VQVPGESQFQFRFHADRYQKPSECRQDLGHLLPGSLWLAEASAQAGPASARPASMQRCFLRETRSRPPKPYCVGRQLDIQLDRDGTRGVPRDGMRFEDAP
jgi:hypothetical protein